MTHHIFSSSSITCTSLPAHCTARLPSTLPSERILWLPISIVFFWSVCLMAYLSSSTTALHAAKKTHTWHAHGVKTDRVWSWPPQLTTRSRASTKRNKHTTRNTATLITLAAIMIRERDMISQAVLWSMFIQAPSQLHAHEDNPVNHA